MYCAFHACWIVPSCLEHLHLQLCRGGGGGGSTGGGGKGGRPPPPPPNFRLQYNPPSSTFHAWHLPCDCPLHNKLTLYQGGLHRGGRGAAAPPTLGYSTQGCLRVHYCLYSVTVYTYIVKSHIIMSILDPPT